MVAVSGGTDSLALLLSLNALKDTLGLRLHVAHLDHMLRSSSYPDLLYVKAIARKLGVPFSAKRINLKILRKKGSLEEIARNKRLDFFVSTAKAVKADKIAVGHTKDDQAETVLMRIIRGSGLYGLSSILPVRSIGGITVIRPLIEIERKEIAGFLNQLQIKPRQDATNQEMKFLRNRVRHELLPLLQKKYNPRIKEVLANLAETSAWDYGLLQELAENSLSVCKCRLDGRNIILNFKEFSQLKKGMQRMVFRLAIEKLSGSTRRITFKHWQEIEDLLMQRAGSAVNLPRQICVFKQKNKLVLTLRNA